MIQLIQSDISTLSVDCIVNAANEYLARGSGVCGAIHKAAGPELANECQRLRPCSTGEAIITSGYNLKSKYVIHAVGPVYDINKIETSALLESAYLQSLKLATQNNLKTIAFPCISTGVYGYPKLEAAEIAIRTVKKYILSNELDIIFCCYESEDYQIYEKLLNE